MQQQDRFNEIITSLQQQAKAISAGNDIVDRLQTLGNKVHSFQLKVPLMGGFNAGKTSLLNAFLERPDYLPTAIVAETAIAAEILYDDQEFIEVIAKDGQCSTHPLSALKLFTHQNSLGVRIHVPAKTLQACTDIRFVDMPGLDSSIEAHSQAVLTYMQEGSYFLILADIEHQLKGSVFDFVKREILPLGFDFAVILTKSDLKEQSEHSSILEKTRALLRQQTGRDIPVAIVSERDGDITGFQEIISSIDADKACKQRFRQNILNEIRSLQQVAAVRKSLVFADVGKIEDSIRSLQKSKAQLDEKFKQESKRIQKEFSDHVVDAILYDVAKSLQDRMEILVSSAKNGQDAFSRAIADILRPALIQSSQNHVNAVLETSMDEICKFQLELGNAQWNFDSSSVTKLKDISTWVDKLKDSRLKEILALLAILTNVVAPWIEIILIFLPNILQFFTNPDEDIRKMVVTQIIPDLQQRLRPKIQESLEEVRSEFITALESQIGNEHKAIEISLQKALADRQANEKKATEESQLFANIEMQLLAYQNELES